MPSTEHARSESQLKLEHRSRHNQRKQAFRVEVLWHVGT